MQLGHAIGALSQTQAHDRHVELAGVTALVVLGTQLQDVGRGHRGGQTRIDEVLHLSTIETIDTRRHRGVGREHRGGTNGREGLVPRHGIGAVLRVHQFLDAFDTQETSVSFIAVEHLGSGGSGDAGVRAQRSDTAHAQEQLLLQTVITSTAVEAVGDVTGVLVVLGNIGIQQQQRDTAHVCAPDLGGQRTGIR